jgi:uncharacterized protein (TIGR00369 family)
VTEKKHSIRVMLDSLKEIVEEKVPLNKLMGIKLEYFNHEEIRLKLSMKEILIGNYAQGILHGGVISTVLDVTGTVTAWSSILMNRNTPSQDEIIAAIARIGTIDLRIDYLRPGRGDFFLASGTILKMGNRITVTRMQLHDDQGILIAVGTGTYTV